MKIALSILTVLLYITGFTVVTIYSNIQVSLGIFILMWASNLERNANKE